MEQLVLEYLQNGDIGLIKDTNVHETFHLITDKNEKFCTFMNEGLTEYMKGMAINSPSSYKNNVDFVRFLHENLGDNIIKSYLTGKPDIFNQQLFNLINYDNNSSMDDIQKFYKNLNMFHTYESDDIEKAVLIYNGATPEIISRATAKADSSKKQYEIVEPEILLMLQKIVVGKIAQMTQNMDFYVKTETGLKLDLERASSQINNLIKNIHGNAFFTSYDLIKNAEWEKQTGILAAEQVLENTHILFGYTDQERNNRKQELIEKMLPHVKITQNTNNRGNTITQVSTIPPVIKNTDVTLLENDNLIQKIFEQKLKDNMNITQYVETFAKIAKVAKLSYNELENYLNKYNIKYFGNISNFKTINQRIINSIPRIEKLSEIDNERKRNTITSEYKSIGNGRFVEKRDNQVFFIELNENGEFSEEEIKYAKKTLFLKDGTRLEFDYQKGLQNLNITLNYKKVNLGKTLSLQDIKDIELAKIFSKDIRENIACGSYFDILDDAENIYQIHGISYSADIDKRTRIIDFNKYILDLKTIIPIIPESQKETFIKYSTQELLDRTYRIQNQKGNPLTDFKLQNSYSAIAKSISEIIDGKDEIQNMNTLSANAQNLSKLRLSMVEENEKKAVVIFKDSTVKSAYYIMKNQREKLENKKNIEKASKNFDYAKFYSKEGEIPLEELPYHLSGVNLTHPIDTRNTIFFYEQFADAAKKVIMEYPSNSQEEIFNSIFSNQIRRTYLITKQDLNSQDLFEAFNNLHNVLKSKIFSDTPIIQDDISSSLEKLNNLRIEKGKDGLKKSGISFRDNHSKDMFFTFSDIIKLIKKSKVRDGELEGEIKSIMNSQLSHESKKEHDTPEQ